MLGLHEPQVPFPCLFGEPEFYLPAVGLSPTQRTLPGELQESCLFNS